MSKLEEMIPVIDQLSEANISDFLKFVEALTSGDMETVEAMEADARRRLVVEVENET